MFKGKNGIYNRYFKRMIDIICALLALGVFWWLYIIVAILVRVKLGSPIIFKQARPGKIDPMTGKETIFYLYKFRTMTDARDINGLPLPDDVRLTKFGRLLRSTSLDELPEVINILKGDMSLVGTRPPTIDEFKQYAGHHKRRLTMKPGITGMWQAYGRNTVTDFEDVVKMDLQYIDNWSLSLDIKILFKTVFTVLKETGR